MAQISWSEAGLGTAYVSASFPTSLTVSGPTFLFPMPKASIKATIPGHSSEKRNYSSVRFNLYSYDTFEQRIGYYAYPKSNTVANDTTWATADGGNATALTSPTSTAFPTSWLFREDTKNKRTVNVTVKCNRRVYYDGDVIGSIDAGSEATAFTTAVTLDVPPTATVSALTTDTQYIYAGLTTASVTVSDATAYYGGDIDSATLTIGSQTASISGNGTLSILLNASGTFTPVVTVTDSRGQTKDYTLDPITVGTYSTPTVNFDAERTTNTGVLDDEGLYATIVTTLTFDPIAEAVAPTVAVTDENGNVIADADIGVVWYSSRNGTLSGVISDWSTVTSGSTVYGLVSIIGGFDTQKSYVISLTPQDSESITGDTKTDTLQTAFYTVDFLAGGHGIAFGKPAVNVGFECGMDATFDETLTAQDMTAQEVQDFVDGVGGGTGAFADKVIEQGTSGSWTYRKWASGIAECWAYFRYTSLAMTTAEGSGYYAPLKTENFPTDLFKSVSPVVTVGAELNGSLGGFAISTASKSSVSGYFWATRSVTKTVCLHIHAIGNWIV